MDNCHNSKQVVSPAAKESPDTAAAGTAIGDMETAQDSSRSGMFLALLLGGGLRPAKAARLTERAPLGVAFVIHAFYGMLIAAMFLVLAAVPSYARWKPEAIVEAVIVYLGFDGITSIYGIKAAQPMLLTFGFYAIWIELAVLAAAFSLAAWSAREEPLRTSWANALRQSWLYTPCFFFGMLSTLIARYFLWGVNSVLWGQSFHIEFLPELICDAYGNFDNGRFMFYMPLRFWEYNGSDTICVLVDCVVLVWLFWALLARIGARASRNDLPPQCKGCGYNLTGLPAPGRCPECGLGFADPRIPNERPGTIWQNERQLGSLRAWVRTAMGLLAKPTTFGKRMQCAPEGNDHRRFFLVGMLFVGVATCFGTVLLYLDTVADTDRLYHARWYDSAYDFANALEYWPLILSGGMVIAATLSVVSAALVTIVIASIVGVCFRLRRGQNMTATAMQSACYASCVLPVLYLVVFQLLSLLITGPLWFADFVTAHPIIADNIGSIFAITCAAVVCIPFLYLSMRVTGTMLHVNR